MLVLSRNQDSAVNIGSDIEVKVLSIKRQTVKLGIKAPENVRVLRNELAPQLDERQHAPTKNQPTAGMRIVLVIEDDAGHAKLIRKALCQHHGTMVTVAGTAQTALDTLGADVTSPDTLVQPDLILLDLGLPDRPGLEVLRMIRSVPALSTTPVVILSCSDDETLVNQCMQNGANAFVPKSAGFDDFHAQVSRIGHFWAGDCFARRSISPQTGEFPMACSDDDAPDSDRFEKHLGGTDRAKRILLADDDAGHVTLIKRAIRRADIDCTVDVVHNGAEAIDYLFGAGERADRQPGEIPDLMLLDLNMPEMNGRQVLQVLRNVGSSQERLRLPPVVVLTSSDLDTDVNDSYSLGAKSFIRKSVDQGQFAQAVQQTTQYWLGLNRPLSGTPSRPMCLPR